jgi:hypothetical protein
MPLIVKSKDCYSGVVYSAMGQENQARIEAKEFLKNWPIFSLKKWRKILRFKDEALN